MLDHETHTRSEEHVEPDVQQESQNNKEVEEKTHSESENVSDKSDSLKHTLSLDSSSENDNSEVSSRDGQDASSPDDKLHSNKPDEKETSEDLSSNDIAEDKSDTHISDQEKDDLPKISDVTQVNVSSSQESPQELKEESAVNESVSQVSTDEAKEKSEQQVTNSVDSSTQDEMKQELVDEESELVHSNNGKNADPSTNDSEGDSLKEEISAKKEKANPATVEKQLLEAVSNSELNLDILNQAYNLLEDKSQPAHILEATIEELILFAKILQDQEHILVHAHKMGLVKRSFEAVREGKTIPTAQVEEFRKHLAAFNQKKSQIQKELDSGKEKNFQRKKGLLQQLTIIVESEDPMRIQEVRAIQDEWKSIGHIPKKEIEPLYKEYRSLLDKFYQMREMHFEMLDYDRRINLQEKERLIVEIQNLIPPEEDRENFDVWKENMDQLLEYQQQWRAVGHIPREDMDRINTEYRAIVDQFFELRQEFLKKQDKIREVNGEKKKEILKNMEEFVSFESQKPRAWNEATQKLQVFQEEWKKIGQAPQQINGELWHKYREICNTFFGKKSAFFKKLDETRAENLEKKRELCEKVEALQNVSSNEWEKTAKEIKAIQRQWKQIGPVPERHSNKLWNRFRAACDVFFEQRRKHYTSIHEEEHINLDKKKVLIKEVKELTENSEIGKSEAIQRVKKVQEQWKEIGKVPYKEKDKIWEEFRAEVDRFFNNLSLRKEEVRELKLKASLNMLDNPEKRARHIKQRIARLRKKINQAKEKVDQYSTNIQYISKGKSGDPLRAQIQKEIDKEKRIIDEWIKRIKMLNDTLKNPEKAVPEEEGQNANESPEQEKNNPSEENGGESTNDASSKVETSSSKQPSGEQSTEESSPSQKTDDQ